jgi:hypothetical protein
LAVKFILLAVKFILLAVKFILIYFILFNKMFNRIFQYPCTQSIDDPKNSKKFKSAKFTGNLQAIFQKSLIWTPGSKGQITVTFGSGCDDGCSPEAAWSQVGKQSNDEEPSMNLGFIDPSYSDFTFNGITYKYTDFKEATRNYCTVPEGTEVPPNALLSNEPIPDYCSKGWVPGATVIHEFCHAFGMLHEHQNNLPDPNDPSKKNPIVIDVGSVINYYKQNGMTEEDAKANVIDVYDCDKDPKECDYMGSRFDPDSIMLYALPDDWIMKGHENPTRPNFKLSQTDIEWLKKVYPFVTNYPQLTVTFLDNDDEPWKEAWVQKVIIEQLLPIVCIGVRFVDTEGRSIDYKPDVLHKVPIESRTQQQITFDRTQSPSSSKSVVGSSSGTVLKSENFSNTKFSFPSIRILLLIIGIIIVMLIIIKLSKKITRK